jgi:hypothetical protein
VLLPLTGAVVVAPLPMPSLPPPSARKRQLLPPFDPSALYRRK